MYSRDWDSHLAHLECVLNTLSSSKFVTNPKKCSFGKSHIEYLGHVISKDGVAADPNKVTSVKNWPLPHNVKGVRGFLGLTVYYRKFIRGYGKIAKPLTDLTKKDGFSWTQEATETFELLKKALITAPVLALPGFNQIFEIESDASGRGLGAILMQRGRSLTYYSKALSPKNLIKSIYEKELMVVALAIQHWRQYLMGANLWFILTKRASNICFNNR